MAISSREFMIRACLSLIIVCVFVMINAKGGAAQTVFDVTKYGAKGDGKTKNENSFITAWKAACNSGSEAKLLIPSGDFVAGEIVFQGPCKNTITIDIKGNILAVNDPSTYTGSAWIYVERLDHVTVTGGGTINGRGSSAWKYAGGNSVLPVSLEFNNVGFGTLNNLHFVDSMGFHVKMNQCHDFTAQHLTIKAPGSSPNTDGIHTSRSTNVKILDSTIGTGDDCVSIGYGTKNLNVERITCGPGHGLSVGSLGKRKDETSLSGITIKNCTIVGTTNGARIKTYHASPSMTATGITFEDIILDQVKNPIIIDQHYDSKKRAEESNVQLSDIHFRNIRGTTTSQVSINLMCSKTHPCKGVELSNIKLTPSGVGSLTTVCANVKPTVTGVFNPASLDKIDCS